MLVKMRVCHGFSVKFSQITSIIDVKFDGGESSLSLRVVMIRDINDTLIFASYSGWTREKFEFSSVIVEPSSSSSNYRASRVRVYQYSAREPNELLF